MTTYILSACMLLLVLVVYLIYKGNTYDKHIEDFIELNNNVTVITTETEIIAMNKSGLDFFGFKKLDDLLKKQKFLSKLFTELDTGNILYVEGINWVTKIDKMKNIRVQMINKNLKQVFNMQVSKIKKDRYQVSFNNISRVVAEKEAITQVAEKDELTQIYNRTKFNTIYTQTLRNAEINFEPFTIILFDVDHFKNVNDTHGHNVGDRVLIQLSSLVKSQLRVQDTFARWGGEEFIILSKTATEKDAFTFATRLQKSIETFPFDTIEKLTCSFGISQYSEDDTLRNLIKRADDALYKAKQSGRNIVCMVD